VTISPPPPFIAKTNLQSESSMLAAEPHVNKDVAGYDFLEDGEPIAESILRGPTNLEGAKGAETDRPVLAELEGVVLQSPPPSTKKVLPPPPS